jgi:MoaA/NifB/PqqE/SkfB family radical SAM enzyme
VSRPSLVLVPQHFGALLYDRTDGRYLAFDADDHRCLVAWSQGAAFRPGDEARGLALVERLAHEGLLQTGGRLVVETIEGEPPVDHLMGPLVCHLEVIARCNLRCRHCFAGELPRREDELSLEEMSALFAELASLGCMRVSLTGGEPLLRKDLLEVIDAARAQGLSVSITTHGLFLDERWARALAERDLLWLNVSLDGATGSTNDAIRGEGVYEQVLARLEAVRGIVPFSLAFTLHRGLVDEVEGCVALADRVGAEAAVFRPLYPVGQAANEPELMPTRAQYDDAQRRLEELGLAARDEVQVFGPSQRADNAAPAAGRELCGAAQTLVSVSVGGDVSGCSYLGPDHVAANLRVRSFTEIWNTGQSMRALRSDAGAFRGGCRARAQAFTGSAFAEDPWVSPRDRGARVLPLVEAP